MDKKTQSGKHKEILAMLIVDPWFKKQEERFHELFPFNSEGLLNFSNEDEVFTAYPQIMSFALSINEHFNLPRPFYHVIFAHLTKRGGEERIENNFTPYDIRVNPREALLWNGERDEDGNPKIEGRKYATEVTLITYSRLTTEERKAAMKELEIWQNYFLPPHLTARTRVSRDIKKSLAIDEEMKTLERKKEMEKIKDGSYLDRYSKAYKPLPRDLKRMKKLHPESIARTNVHKTSGDIAKKILGSRKRASTARSISVRFNQKRKKMLG